MPEKWLQIKGDPAIRGFLFQQQRVESLFDKSIGRIHDIVHTLLTRKGIFHVKIHYSSSQLTCWFVHDPFCYKKYVREEVLEKDFLDHFPNAGFTDRPPVLGSNSIKRVFNEFHRLRLTDQTIYLRNGSINMIDGMINMGFSCDGSHYIDHHTFFAKLDNFVTS